MKRQIHKHRSRLPIGAGLTCLAVLIWATRPALAGDAGPATTPPDIFVLLPVIVAIVLALVLRHVVPAIFAGLLTGSILIHGLSIEGLWRGLLDTFGVHVIGALVDKDHISIIFFSLMIGGLVGIINKNGGTAGIVRTLSSIASTRKRGQLATATLGTAIFFDDYANTMVVGNTMRPITDRLGISREKLAYLVDSTAAPIASLALITTWIGFQVGLIDDATQSLDGVNMSAYAIFLAALPYGFYSILAIVLVYLIAATGRDFGPMLKAERRALQKQQLPDVKSPPLPGEVRSAPPRALNAVLPLMVLTLGALMGIYMTGKAGLPDSASLRQIIGNGNSYLAMTWSSALAVLLAVFLSMAHRSLTLERALEAMIEGIKTFLPAIIILTLAWALSGVNEELQTATFLSESLSAHIAPALLPTGIFLLAAAMAFATGSSWGVMGILVPLTVPLAWALVQHQGVDAVTHPVFLASIASLLSGAVWGDHCSPISDTTILSSMASGCDHMAHVKTQIPYALTTGGIAIVFGLIPVGYGVSIWLCLSISVSVLIAIVLFLGKRVASQEVDQLKS